MINLKEVYKIQSEYGVADDSFKDSEISFEDYLAQCRMFISRNLPEDYNKGNWDTEKKLSTLINLTSLFVDKHRVNVKGYSSSEGLLDTQTLLDDLCDSVTGEAIVKEALADPEVDEIQINDKNTIFVIRKGIPEYYTDSKGRVMQFSNNDEIHTLLNKLIDDGTGNLPQFTDGVPLLNAKTAKHQYRINAVHHVANTMDKPPYNDFCILLWNTPKFLKFIKPYMTEYQYLTYQRNNKANRKLVDYKFDEAPYYFGNVTESDICYNCRKESEVCADCDSLETVTKCYTCDNCKCKNCGVVDLSYVDDLIYMTEDDTDIDTDDTPITEEELLRNEKIMEGFSQIMGVTNVISESEEELTHPDIL